MFEVGTEYRQEAKKPRRNTIYAVSLFEVLFKQTNTTVHRLAKIFGHIYMCLTVLPFHCNKRENVMVFSCFLFWEDTYFPTAMTLAISSLVPFMETFPNLRTR